jgi:hypothetical protein
VTTAFLAIAVVTFACFAPSLRNDLLIWDDAGYIWENPNVQRLDLGTVAWAFTEYHANLWAPLTWLSLALDHALWGLDPVGYHLTNVLLHALNAGLFFLVSLELARAHLASARPASPRVRQPERRAVWGALLAALLFGLHPLRVESVAWAAERKDVLGLFLGLAAVLAYLRHAAASGARTEAVEGRLPGFAPSSTYGLALALFCLSLLAKPMLVTLPVVLLLVDWIPLGRVRGAGWSRLVAEKVPFLLASAAAGLVAADSLRPNITPLAQAGVLSRVLVAVESTAAYLWLTAWPLDVSPFYLHPGNVERIGPEHVGSAVLVVAITVACGLAARRRPIFLVAWVAYLVALAPMLGFIQVGPQAMAARFTYFPSLPIALLLGSGLASAVLGARRRGTAALLAAATAAWLLALSAVTVRHISFWKDDVTLWTRVIELAPDLAEAARSR